MTNEELTKKEKNELIDLQPTPSKEPVKKNTYSPLLNAKGSNGLVTLPVTAKAIKARFTYYPDVDEGSLFTRDDLKVMITNYNNLTHLGNSILFLFYCLKEYTKTVPSKKVNNGLDYKRFRASLIKRDTRTIAIHFEDYLASKNIPDTPDNRKNAKRDLRAYYETLKNVHFEFTDYSTTQKKLLNYSLNLFSGTAEEVSEIKRSGDIYFILNTDFIDYLTENNFITYISDNVYNIKLREHPNALAIIFKLSVMYSMNFLKANRGLVSVKDLLADVLNIPSYEEVKKQKNSPYRAIIEPMERDLDYLQDYGLLKQWEYCNEKREPLSKDQLENYGYNTLIKCYIKYELADYPTELQDKRLESLEEKKEAKKARATRKKTTKKE